jgi:hypothetical protein
MSEQPEMVDAGDDPVADDTDHPEYADDMIEGTTEDGTPVPSEYDSESETAS